MGRKLVVVDDDEQCLQCARSLLEEAGYEVLIARSVSEARKALDGDLPDLLLLEVLLASGDGPAFACELASDNRLADIPVVYVTRGAETRGHMMQALRNDEWPPSSDILPKSSMKKHLVDAVNDILGSAESGARAGGHLQGGR